ncbi:MAG: glycosyltransferase [Eubacterium sp.]|nr:glycosyltransferase [Eubacterium sp.]
MEGDIVGKHVFVVCAYKESIYLEECIQSLKRQTIPSNIIMVTSTPNKYIEDLAEKYDLPCYVNPGQGGITQDWNYGYKCAKEIKGVRYVTIAHQDDIYEPEYLAHALISFKHSKKPLIFFTDYYEIRNGQRVEKDQLLLIKRIMLLPLRVRMFQGCRWIRRRVLSFGSPICCPSVCFAIKNMPDIIFRDGFLACEDWEAWEMLSKREGEFLYCKEILMGHRIHEESVTSAIIHDNKRSDEEYKMFRKFWPERIAKLLVRLYSVGQKSNQL